MPSGWYAIATELWASTRNRIVEDSGDSCMIWFFERLAELRVTVRYWRVAAEEWWMLERGLYEGSCVYEIGASALGSFRFSETPIMGWVITLEPYRSSRTLAWCQDNLPRIFLCSKFLPSAPALSEPEPLRHLMFGGSRERSTLISLAMLALYATPK